MAGDEAAVVTCVLSVVVVGVLVLMLLQPFVLDQVVLHVQRVSVGDAGVAVAIAAAPFDHSRDTSTRNSIRASSSTSSSTHRDSIATIGCHNGHKHHSWNRSSTPSSGQVRVPRMRPSYWPTKYARNTSHSSTLQSIGNRTYPVPTRFHDRRYSSSLGNAETLLMQALAIRNRGRRHLTRNCLGRAM